MLSPLGLRLKQGVTGIGIPDTGLVGLSTKAS